MMSPDTIAIGVMVLAAATALIGLAWARRRNFAGLALTGRELAISGQIVFIVAGVMLIVTLRNATDLPAGQFIYGRF